MLHIDKEIYKLERRLIPILLSLQHHRYRSFSRLKGKAARFQLLDVIQHRQHFLAFHFHTMLLGFAQ